MPGLSRFARKSLTRRRLSLSKHVHNFVDRDLEKLYLFRCAAALCLFTLSAGDAQAASREEARLTQVIRDVTLLSSDSETRPALAGEKVGEGAALRTGRASRAELTFTDQTVTRVGGNTTLGLGKAARIFELSNGAILMQVPKAADKAKVKIGAATAVIRGTTSLLEHNPSGYIKFIVLQGTGRMHLNRWGESVLIRAGQMLILNPKAKQLPEAVDIDLERLLKTCRLITDFPPLPHGALLARAADDQRNRKTKGKFIDTNLVIFGRGTLVSLVDPANEQPTPSPSPALSPK
jgi:hypothetical protein